MYALLIVLKDGSKVISAGGDKTARAFDLATGQNSQVAVHDAPIKSCRWIDSPGAGYLVTGSWDKTIKVVYPVFICYCLLTLETSTGICSPPIQLPPFLSPIGVIVSILFILFSSSPQQSDTL